MRSDTPSTRATSSIVIGRNRWFGTQRPSLSTNCRGLI